MVAIKYWVRIANRSRPSRHKERHDRITITTTPPVLPDASDPKPKSRKWLWVIGIVLGLGFIGSFLPDEDTAAITPVAAITPTTVAVVPVATEAPAPTAAPAPVSGSDWDSPEAYALDVSDSANKMAELMTTFSDVATDAANGELTMGQFVLLSETAAVSAASHYDYFNGTIPPPGYELTHQHMLNGLRAAVGGFEAASEGTIEGIERCAALLVQVGTDFDKATAALPS